MFDIFLERKVYSGKLNCMHTVLHRLKKPFFPGIVGRYITNTHGERLVFHSIQYRNDWLAASDLFDMFTQSIKSYTFHYQYRCSKNVIHHIDSKNGWLLLSASFTAKFRLVFVLTLENAFSLRFHFQANRKSIGSSKKQ